ncbi:MAG: tRNA (guanosine(37)-N1)-methyltransferase TrmD [Bacteriovoracaceae bacterium]|nr:tRNA (guanosine(37)-N1)-methyltransferase TrmD [Bacteriovoracaceae bacterium]
MKKIWVITLFPDFFKPIFETGVVGAALRGERADLPEVNFINPSDYSEKGFKGVDAGPYGGGAGQVIRADILENALLDGIFIKGEYLGPLEENLKVIYLGPRGKSFNQSLAFKYQSYLLDDTSKDLVFICGRYEGIDERFIEKYVEEHLSLGDFVLSGGELALLPILDAIFRLFPGVLNNEDSPLEESFDGVGLEFPQYTKPQIACDKEVPKILLSGHHENIKTWRKQERVKMTQKYRPDLLKKGDTE